MTTMTQKELSKLDILETDYYTLPEFFNEEPLEIVPFEYSDVKLIVPKIALAYIPKVRLRDFPAHFCGAGHGFSEKIIPDTLWWFFKKVKISPACLVHDLEYVFAPPTWDAFRASDSRLKDNIHNLVDSKIKGSWHRKAFYVMAAVYLLSVDMFGKYVFWELKKKQGHKLPESARWYLGENH